MQLLTILFLFLLEFFVSWYCLFRICSWQMMCLIVQKTQPCQSSFMLIRRRIHKRGVWLKERKMWDWVCSLFWCSMFMYYIIICYSYSKLLRWQQIINSIVLFLFRLSQIMFFPCSFQLLLFTIFIESHLSLTLSCDNDLSCSFMWPRLLLIRCTSPLVSGPNIDGELVSYLFLIH